MVSDLLSLLVGCIPIYLARDPIGFRFTVVLAVFLAGVCWYACHIYTRLWNKSFRMSVPHHLLCAFASLCTLFFTILFASLFCMKDAALLSIDIWEIQLKVDTVWATQTFEKTYQEIKDSGTEDFSNTPPPGTPGSMIPTNSQDSLQAAASSYTKEACRHFSLKRPFLSKLAWNEPGVSSELIVEDIKKWHEVSPEYPPSRAIDIAADQIKQGIEPQLPRLVFFSRLSMLSFFLLIQAFPFGVIGWAAYRDIRPRS